MSLSTFVRSENFHIPINKMSSWVELLLRNFAEVKKNHFSTQVFTIQEFKAALKNNCYNLPLWVLLLGNFSQLAMMINSSANFFIYCFMSNVFRECLFDALLKLIRLIGLAKVGNFFVRTHSSNIFLVGSSWFHTLAKILCRRKLMKAQLKLLPEILFSIKFRSKALSG